MGRTTSWSSRFKDVEKTSLKSLCFVKSSTLQGSILGSIPFNSFTSDQGSGMEYTSNKFVDNNKPGERVGKICSRPRLSLRDLNKFEKCPDKLPEI